MSITESLKNRKADINVYYKNDGELSLPLQVFLPEDFDRNKNYKTVIAVHGGAWASLKETPVDWDGGWMACNAKYYTQKGCVGIVFSYRDIDFDENTDVGDILEDCNDALDYIKNEFSFVDLDDVIFMGDSAGGHLVLSLALELAESGASSIQPKYIAAYNPVTDCECEKWKYCAKDGDGAKFSPIHNVKKINSKILVMHGTNDTVVDIENSHKFVEKMKDAGNDITMVDFPDAAHAFILFGYMSEESDILKAAEITDKWLGLV